MDDLGGIHYLVNCIQNLVDLSSLSYACLDPDPCGSVRFAVYLQNSKGVLPANRLRKFDYHAFVLITRGCGAYRDESGLSLPVNAGDSIMVRPGVGHHYGPAPGSTWDEVVFVLEGQLFEEWALRYAKRMPVIACNEPPRQASPATPPQEGNPSACPLYERSTSNFPPRSHSGRGGQGVRGLAYKPPRPPDTPLRERTLEQIAILPGLLASSPPFSAALHTLGVIESITGQTPAGTTNPVLEKAYSFMEANFGPEFSLQLVADELGMSYEAFRRWFKAETGSSPYQYRLNKKLERAKSLIDLTNLTLEAVAIELGFSSAFHLSYAHKKKFGYSPTKRR